MKKPLFIFMLLLLYGFTCPAYAQETPPPVQASPAEQTESAIDQAQKKADEDARKAREEAARKEADILEQNGQLAAEIQKLEALKKERDTVNDALKKRYEENEKNVEHLKKRSEEQKNEADELSGSVRGIAQDLGIAISQSMVSGEKPGRKKILEPLVLQTDFPALDNIKQMGDLLFDEIGRNGKISTATLSYIDTTGTQTTGEVIRIGVFNALWRKDGDVGYLEYAPAKETFTQFGVPMPGALTGEAERFVEKKSIGLFIDPSSGGAFRQLSDMPDWWEELKSGGALMWPICFLAFVALFMILERVIVLLRESKLTSEFSDKVTPLIQSGRWDQALRLCDTSKTCISKVLTVGINHRNEQPEVIESVIEESIQGSLGPLDRNMNSLQIIAVVEPLLGLLGTVTGMITTFQMLTIYGSGDPRMMSGGISEALVTTEYGLFISIPIILIHGYFQSRIDRITSTMEEKCMMLVNSVKKSTGATA